MGTHYQGEAAEKLALDTFIKLYRAAESVSARINAHLVEHDLTVSQFGVLEALYHLGPQHQAQLADKILKTTGNLTHVIDQLEQRALVVRQRNPNDRRYITVYLTDSGQALIERLFPRHVAQVAAAFDCLSEAEQVELGRLCKKIGLGGAE